MQGQRIAVYARYSDDKQNPRSIEDQLRVCREHIERLGGKIHPDLVFADAAIVGSTTVRPGFQALQKAVKDRLVDVVVTEALDRVGRDIANNAQFLKDFQSRGARLLAINDGIDTGQQGSKMLYALKSAMSEDYLDALSAKTKRGMDGVFNAGMSTGGRTFGYRSVPAGDGSKRKRIEVDPAEAAVVQRVFAWYVDGHGIRSIADRLNASGVTGPRGGKWGHMTIRSLLANVVYTGLVIFNNKHWVRDGETGKRRYVERPVSERKRQERPELRIIDPIVWEQVKAKRSETRMTYALGQRPKASYPLSGLLICEECGQAMTIGGGQEGRRYYYCGSYRKGHGCKNTQPVLESSIRRWVLDRILETAGKELLETMRSQWAMSLGDKDRALKLELTQRRAALTRTEAQSSKLLDAFLEDKIDAASMKGKLKEKEDYAELQRATIARLSAELASVPSIPSLDQLREFLRLLPQLLELEPVEARTIMRGLVRAGEIRLRPAGAQGYHVSFSLVPGQLMGLGIAPVFAEAMPSGSCGGRILPLGILQDLMISGLCPRHY